MTYKLIIETEELEEIRNHSNVNKLISSIYEFDQDLRALIKYGATNCGRLKASETGDEIPYIENVRDHLHKILAENGIQDSILG